MNTTNHLVSHIKNGTLRSDNTLHVIAVCENPMRYHSRYRLFREWRDAMEKTDNVIVYTVEAAYKDRHFEVTDSDNPRHLQLHSHQPIWHKENMQNLAIKTLLPKDWAYVCTCDADVFFQNPGWALESIHQMQDYSVIQPWSHCVDHGYHGEALQMFNSFCFQHLRGEQKQTHPSQPYKYAHTGYAWCYRRDFYEAVQQFLDWCILGSADHHQAFALIGEVNKTIHKGMTPNFFKLCYEWQYLAYRHTNGLLGYVPGTIDHKFHGKKAQRKYRERWQILVDNHFDPIKDIVHDTQGVVKVVGKPHLVHECRMYMRHRNEDTIENF